MSSVTPTYKCKYVETHPALAVGFPVLLNAYAIHMNEADGYSILQCSFSSIREGTLVSLYIRVTYSGTGFENNGVIDEFCYNKCYSDPYETFGEDTPIYLPLGTQEVCITLLAAVFQDEYYYCESGSPFVTIKSPRIFRPESDELKKQFLRDDAEFQTSSLSGNIIYIAEDFQNYRICCCGAINMPDTSVCNRCGRILSLTRGLQNATNLKKRQYEFQRQLADQEEHIKRRHDQLIKIEKAVIKYTLRITVAIVVLYAVAEGVFQLWQKVIQPSMVYKAGLAAIENDDYVNAVRLLNRVSGFRDSAEILEKYRSDRYSAGKAYMEAEDYNGAIQIFSDMTGYRDSEELLASANNKILRSALLEQALLSIAEDDYPAALASFDGLKDDPVYYKKYTEYRRTRYNRAIELFEDGKSAEALALLKPMIDYPDAERLILEIEHQNDQDYQYKSAEDYLDKGDYLNAVFVFQQLGDYKDSRMRVNEILKDRKSFITLSLANEDFISAADALNNLPSAIAVDFLKAEQQQTVIRFLCEMEDKDKLKYLILLDNIDLSLAVSEIGDVIPFGQIEQNNSAKDGKEPIEWIILDEKDGYALLLSRRILKYSVFSPRTGASWENSTVREWLNDSFYTDSFSEEERSRIRQQWLRSVNNYMYPKPFDSTPWNDTFDHIFLLTLEDVNAYRELFMDTVPTVSAAAEGSKYRESWWLSTRGRDNNTATGMINNEPQFIGFDKSLELGVRPALWIRIKS